MNQLAVSRSEGPEPWVFVRLVFDVVLRDANGQQ